MNKWRIFYWLVLMVLCSVVGQSVAQVSSAEREALIDLYHATGGDDWLNNEGWLGDPGTECQWHGVSCLTMGTTRVTALFLSDNNLSGALPDSLSALDELVNLGLVGNGLGGEIPVDLWGLSGLELISLADNHFSGPVPAILLGLSSDWQDPVVDLSGNLFDAFDVTIAPPEALGANIRINLADNRIAELPPPSWRETGAIERLDLSGNLLNGSFDLDHTPWPGLQHLVLADNAIDDLAGLNTPELTLLDISRNQLVHWPLTVETAPHLATLYLNGNRLEGTFPEWLTELPLESLDLADNRLSGELPEAMTQLALYHFDLGNNALSGPISRAFDAMNQEFSALWLLLGNNRFEGELPADFDYSRLSGSHGMQGNVSRIMRDGIHGLDLCWNDIAMPDADLLETLRPAHRGRELASCIGRSRQALDATISGSWYAPARAGEGISQLMLESGQVLSYWFTYNPPPDWGAEPGQRWYMGLADAAESWVELTPLWITSDGHFGQGLTEGGHMFASNAWSRQDRIGEDTLHFYYDYLGSAICITGLCSWETYTERFDKTRLTRIAGTTCDNQSVYQHLSGAWFSPERAGEGFVVEVLADNSAVVYWFTYAPDGSGRQAWMFGHGQFQPETLLIYQGSVVIDELVQPVGGVFGPDFDPQAVELMPWGTLNVAFSAFNDDKGHVWFESIDDDFGVGDYPIERLARPMLAECE